MKPQKYGSNLNSSVTYIYNSLLLLKSRRKSDLWTKDEVVCFFKNIYMLIYNIVEFNWKRQYQLKILMLPSSNGVEIK